MRISKSGFSRQLFSLLVGLVLTLVFTNCGSEGDTQLFQTLNSTCATDDCSEGLREDLLLTINSPFSLSTDGRREINIGGDCDAGAFPDNEIVWAMYPKDGSKTPNSSYNANNNILNIDLSTTCENFRYSLRIVFPNGDPISKDYELVVQIHGINYDAYGNPVVQGPETFAGRKFMVLTP